MQSLLSLSGMHWPVPDYSTLCRRQLCLNVQVRYQRSAIGLHLLVNSTGIKFLGEGEWKCKKLGPERRRQWRKLNIGMNRHCSFAPSGLPRQTLLNSGGMSGMEPTTHSWSMKLWCSVVSSR